MAKATKEGQGPHVVDRPGRCYDEARRAFVRRILADAAFVDDLETLPRRAAHRRTRATQLARPDRAAAHVSRRARHLPGHASSGTSASSTRTTGGRSTTTPAARCSTRSRRSPRSTLCRTIDDRRDRSCGSFAGVLEHRRSDPDLVRVRRLRAAGDRPAPARTTWSRSPAATSSSWCPCRIGDGLGRHDGARAGGRVDGRSDRSASSTAGPCGVDELFAGSRSLCSRRDRP